MGRKDGGGDASVGSPDRGPWDLGSDWTVSHRVGTVIFIGVVSMWSEEGVGRGRFLSVVTRVDPTQRPVVHGSVDLYSCPHPMGSPARPSSESS